MKRKYLPTFADLVDRLSICILKSIFIPQNKKEYQAEIQDIMHDLDLMIKEGHVVLNAKAIRAMLVIMLSNRYIWENESKCRSGENQDWSLLKLTHSINGVRNTAKNALANETGERKDLKIDCLAAELKSDFQNWEIFTDEGH